MYCFSTKTKPIVWREKQYKKVGMICGGTGITPFYQILLSASENKDTIEYTLIFGNRTSKDVLLRNEINNMVKEGNILLKVYYTIDKEEEGWDGLVGYVTQDKLEKYLPPPAEDTLILLCGRGKFCNKYITPMLIELGYKKDDIFKF
jgi:cytochrome-b5 reductase